MNDLIAIVRPPDNSYTKCISNHPQKATIDIYKALSQHEKYVQCLKNLGCKIIELPALKERPDSCFVEDRCVIAGDKAAICPSHVNSRKKEESAIIKLISTYKKIDFIQRPGYIDGGDIIIIGDTLYGGLSKRSNLNGLKQLANILDKELVVIKIPSKVLHLKTISSFIGSNTIFVREDLNHLWKDKGFNVVKVPMKEEHAANCIAIGNKIIVPAQSTETINFLNKLKYEIFEVDMSEFQKGDGSLTCLSLIFEF